MIRTSLHLAAALLCLSTSAARADGNGPWLTDFGAASEKAARENKDLLIHFAGSDWCGWCMKLEKEVFAREDFTAKAGGEFVLVTIDSPRRKALAPGLAQQNAVLKKQYMVFTFPTVVVCDPMGRPYARTGYRKGGPGAYLAHLATLKKNKTARDAGLAAAADLDGVDKARALQKALSHVPPIALPFYDKEIAALHAADPGDATGFYNRYLIRKTTTELGFIIKPFIAKGAHKEVLAEVDRYILENRLRDEPLQAALMFKLTTHYLTKNHREAVKCADEIIAINDVNNPGRYAAMLRKRLLRKTGKQ